MNRRRLYRCDHDRKIAGVASGLAEYLDIDVTLIRILWVVSIFFGGLGLLLYIIMALVVPMEPDARMADPSMPATGSPDAGTDPGTADPAAAGVAAEPVGWHQPVPARHRHADGGGRRGSGFGLTLIGVILVLGGSLALLDAVIPAWGDGRYWWPTFILGLGVILIVMATQRRQSHS